MNRRITEIAMCRYFVICPFCGTEVPLPEGEPDDLFKVVGCLECDASFDYAPDEVHRHRPSAHN